MTRALRGLIRVKRAIALLTMVGASITPGSRALASRGTLWMTVVPTRNEHVCSRHGPLRTPESFENRYRNTQAEPRGPARGRRTLRRNRDFASEMRSALQAGACHGHAMRTQGGSRVPRCKGALHRGGGPSERPTRRHRSRWVAPHMTYEGAIDRDGWHLT